MSDHSIRPYARLLTMLGEQLIKNERIALVELIKNSYDADANWVKVTFDGFSEDYSFDARAKIVIEDDGDGMSRDLIENHLLNPATPVKKKAKRLKSTTKKGRIIQGEKGIGRFAMFKLGRKVTIFTKRSDEMLEHKVVYDFSQFDEDFVAQPGENASEEEKEKEKHVYLDELKVQLTSEAPNRFNKRTTAFGTRDKLRSGHGTIIEIESLIGSWSHKKVEFVARDLTKLQSISPNTEVSDFEVAIYRNEEHQNLHADYLEKLNFLLNERAVFKVVGRYDAKQQCYDFKLNDSPMNLSLRDPLIAGLKAFKDRFGPAGRVLDERELSCGPFEFEFYVFDFSNEAPSKYKLDKEDKSIIKEHRIYLYRDNIRVYPYGEPDDDWLRIDAYRGTISAGHFLSNDQVVGFVKISQDENPQLKDKTNREGLLDQGDALDDFVVLIQTLLAYVRQKPYARYRNDLKNKLTNKLVHQEQTQLAFEELREIVSDNKEAQKVIADAEKKYKAEMRYLKRRAETTEELAGVGLSVETASHDIMAIIGRIVANVDGLIRDFMSDEEINSSRALSELESIRGGIGFVEAQLKDIQLLFKSSKQRRKLIRVSDVIEKVERIYKRLMNSKGIEFTIHKEGSPLVVKTTDAVLLQLFLNLFDNSVYWLQQTSQSSRRIEVLLDGSRGRAIFADNGPGIDEDDRAYIFEPFYSGKGEEGRGLGLYIARQLLERNDNAIRLAEISSERLLSGANFVIDFAGEES